MVLGGLLAGGTITTAQDASTNGAPKKGGKGPMNLERRMERLTTELKLTDAQQPKVKAVLEESVKSMQGLRDLTQDERLTKLQSIREEEAKKMKEILTPDQMVKYTESRQNMGKNSQGKKKTE